MNRLTKFKAWDFDLGRFRKPNECAQLVIRLNGRVTEGSTVPDIRVVQFTGIQDMNGLNIYESDLVKRHGITGQVVWVCEHNALGFYLKSGKDLFNVINPNTSWSLEKVGNILENPELI